MQTYFSICDRLPINQPLTANIELRNVTSKQ